MVPNMPNDPSSTPNPSPTPYPTPPLVYPTTPSLPNHPPAPATIWVSLCWKGFGKYPPEASFWCKWQGVQKATGSVTSIVAHEQHAKNIHTLLTESVSSGLGACRDRPQQFLHLQENHQHFRSSGLGGVGGFYVQQNKKRCEQRRDETLTRFHKSLSCFENLHQFACCILTRSSAQTSNLPWREVSRTRRSGWFKRSNSIREVARLLPLSLVTWGFEGEGLGASG